MYNETNSGSESSRASQRRKSRLMRRKQILLICSIAVLVIGLVGGSIAYLLTKTDSVVNRFTPADSQVDINEDFDNVVKKNVNFTNKSDYPVFVRAKYVANWVMGEGDSKQVYPGTPEIDKDINTSDWVLKDDGYYYYNQVVAAEATTPNFINKIGYKDDNAPPEGYHLEVNVIVETVQSDPLDAVNELWGFVPTATTIDG